VAQVAWAASFYVDWTGDADFARGPGLRLLVETARYWASRARTEPDGTAHIYGIIGPDEYHEPVDDNALTNVMARWNLRRALDALRRDAPTNAVSAHDVSVVEQHTWRELAEALVDNYDANTGIYEQFAGFFALEPLLIADVAPRRPIAADFLLGRERVRSAQVVKQADVVMLHHLVPEEVAPDSLEPNLRYYEPRTAHGSSLSPAVHAALFARVRDYDRALAALRIASRIDLDDLTGSTAGGLHLATMGGLWQAFAFGFAGLRARDGSLHVDPHIPPCWRSLELRVRFMGSRVRLRAEPSGFEVLADQPVTIVVGGDAVSVGPSGRFFRRRGQTWEVE
jgi:trehalose/maltose hydrolase-like predicted phosphorylase